MIRKDYFLRMIEEFFQILARILQLKNNEKTKEAEILISETMQRFLKISEAQIQAISTEEIIDFLQNQENLSIEHWKILADLLKVKGEILLEKDKQALAEDYLTKSLLLWQWIAANQIGVFSFEIQTKITQIQTLLDEE